MDILQLKVLSELGLGLIVAVAVVICWQPRNKKLPLPPGPPGEFLLGHTRVMPRENVAETYAKWSKQYNSDVIHVKSLGQSIIVLNSVEAAKGILDHKSANFCDRPRFTLLEVMGWGKTLTFLPHGKRWLMHRKMLQTSFSNTNVRQWHSLQIKEARRTIANIIRHPAGWETSIRRMAVAIVLQVSYGTDVPADDDPYIQIANDAMHATGNGGAPANSIVDILPLGCRLIAVARHLPNWLLRDWSLRFAREWRWAIQKLHDVPFAAAQAEHANSANNASLAHQLLSVYRSNESLGENNEWTLEDIKGAAGAVFIAGADTTWATCVIFILNMVLHPEVQEKARKELDAVISPGRLPEFSDRQLLPYIEHIVQEVYRWSPLAPLGMISLRPILPMALTRELQPGIPHKSLKDDVYNGMFIPKGKFSLAAISKLTAGAHYLMQGMINHDPGFEDAALSDKPLRSIVYANAHAMAHDERLYRAPHEFDPDRICIGRFLADNSVWMMVATMLATLEFHKSLDQDRNPIEPRVAFTNGGTWLVLTEYLVTPLAWRTASIGVLGLPWPALLLTY
ncbi:hypothetical protein G7046_g8144 [Stylonectria norvegica]|nr:hypothetical protein G7046_g8144 [Stylonectria norvegica]